MKTSLGSLHLRVKTTGLKISKQEQLQRKKLYLIMSILTRSKKMVRYHCHIRNIQILCIHGLGAFSEVFLNVLKRLKFLKPRKVFTPLTYIICTTSTL